MVKRYEPDDPMELVGVALSAADDGAMDEMARCLVEEYVRDGWDAERLLALFRNPFYRALHMICRARGEDYVKTIIAEVCARWGAWQITAGDGEERGGA